MRLDGDNEPQPDAVLRLANGGQSSISPDDYIEGAPELIVEIAASSASYDLHDKLRVYRRNGVQEYIVWRTYSRDLLLKIGENERRIAELNRQLAQAQVARQYQEVRAPETGTVFELQAHTPRLCGLSHSADRLADGGGVHHQSGYRLCGTGDGGGCAGGFLPV